MDKNGNSFNFDKSYSVSFPIGLNLYKSDKIGFSFELAPAIKFENNASEVSNLVFHPGVIFPLKHGFSYLTRLAFETIGQYGLTPVLSKTIVTRKTLSYFMRVVAPVRIGNEKPTSIGLALQFGVAF
ncbi:hypothetical protein G7074_00885 [Pedobacter sp. HDW13]|uniref:hypothetical protein n=1 Tax=Pedobacter sp. HDW13 TaxID=2714940 RepID=UPI00140E1B81|nr:hypothetical protein [Pedobacter sp. HDW13]QIL37964.1 hypothetical protein G7074_00885 [Pedobacter sp. HDW13]